MNFGEKLYDLRRKQGFSQEQLAEKLNVTRQTVSKWELGQSTPDANKLIEISKVLEVNINELTSDDSKSAKKSYDPNELHPRKWLLIVLVIVEIIIAIVLINKVVIDKKNKKEEGSWGIFDVFKSTFNFDSSFETDSFNNKFSVLYSGEQYGTSTKNLIDAIINSNKTDKDHQIDVIYNNEKLGEDKLIDFKRGINTWDKYDISYDYNEEGYISTAKIDILVKDKSMIESFNSSFEFRSGEQTAAGVKILLDNIIKNNNNKEHIINVVYDSINTSNENEIRGLKDKFVNFNGYDIAYYEVILGYDDAGYVNLITIQNK